MESVKIYDVKKTSSANYFALKSTDYKSFYWDEKSFSSNKIGDYVFVVNAEGGEALLTRLAEKGIIPSHVNGESHFTHQGEGFTAKGEYKEFFRFDILDRVTFSNWKWTRSTGQAQVYHLWRDDGKLDKVPERLEKIKDLKRIFKKKKTVAILDRCIDLMEGRAVRSKSVRASKREVAVKDMADATFKGPIQNSEVEENEKREFNPDSSNDFMPLQPEHRQLLMALKTKPLVLLAGISGIGKSRLARTLAYLTCSKQDLQDEQNPGNFLLIAVRPNWHDSTELLGYESSMTGKTEYKITPFIKFLVKAYLNPDIPFILCMDEMNLAPVEQYFAEYLSAIESRRVHRGTVVTDSLIHAGIFKKFQHAHEFWEGLDLSGQRELQYKFLKNGLGIPGNLVVIGTVNMDETTHSFSRKVLDRAMTIEMNEVQLDQGLKAGDQVWKYPRKFYGKDLVCGFPMPIAEIYKGYKKAVDVIDHLKEVNKVLENTPFKIAYRVRDEALAYCYHHAKLYGDDKEPWLEVALDEITHMKVLPRIEGDEAKCRTPLMGLLTFFDEKKMQSSVRKVKEMLDRLKFGYTSYFP